MRTYKYNARSGLRKAVDRAKTIKLTAASGLSLLAILAGLAAPMSIGIAHAQGGSGGGGGGTSGGGSTGGGGGGGSTTDPTTIIKSSCDPVASFTASADLTGITSNFVQALCVSGKTTETLSFRNTTTGVVEYSITDPASSSAFYGNPTFNAPYTAELVLKSLKTTPATVIATRTIALTTPSLPANCAKITHENLSTGYWVNYAAIWTDYAVTDCGYGRQSVEMKITNLTSGQQEADYTSYPTNALIDYEGPQVNYDSNYQIEIFAHGAMGEVLDSSLQTIVCPPSE